MMIIMIMVMIMNLISYIGCFINTNTTNNNHNNNNTKRTNNDNSNEHTENYNNDNNSEVLELCDDENEPRADAWLRRGCRIVPIVACLGLSGCQNIWRTDEVGFQDRRLSEMAREIRAPDVQAERRDPFVVSNKALEISRNLGY